MRKKVIVVSDVDEIIGMPIMDEAIADYICCRRTGGVHFYKNRIGKCGFHSFEEVFKLIKVTGNPALWELIPPDDIVKWRQHES